MRFIRSGRPASSRPAGAWASNTGGRDLGTQNRTERSNDSFGLWTRNVLRFIGLARPRPACGSWTNFSSRKDKVRAFYRASGLTGQLAQSGPPPIARLLAPAQI